MTKHVDGLLDDYFYNRWNATSAPSAGATCSASSGRGVGSGNANAMPTLSRNILEAIVFSILNRTAAATTATLEIREASIGGSVLASVDIITAASATSADCYSQYYQYATRGNDISVSFNTVQASVTQKINISGWTEQSR